MNNWDPAKEAFHNKQFNPNLGRSGQDEGKGMLYVIGIPLEISERGFQNLFEKYGKVIYQKFLPQKNEAHSTRAGFIHYGSMSEAEAAIRALNGVELGDGRLRVTIAHPKKPKGNFDDMANKIEVGPMIDAEVNSLTKKAEEKFEEKRSRANSSHHLNGNQSFGSSSEKSKRRSLGKTASNSFSQSSPKSITKPTSDNLAASNSFSHQRKEYSLSPQQNLSSQQSSHSMISPNNNKPNQGVSKPCDICGVLASKYCSYCCSVYYCSEACQVKGWKEHKLKCKQLANERTDALLYEESDTDEPLVCVEEALCEDVARLMKSLSTKEQSDKKSSKAASAAPTTNTQIKSFTSQLKDGAVLNLTVIDIDAPAAFIVGQLADPESCKKLSQLDEDLNNFYNSNNAQIFVNPAIGDCCAAIYSDDNRWYRSKITNFSDDNQQAVVQFLDYGNSDFVDCNKLMCLNERFCVLPAFSLLCKLAGSSVAESWTSKQTSFLVELLQQNDMQLKVKCNKLDGDFVIGEVMCGDVSVNENMKRLGPVKSPKIPDVKSPPVLKTPPAKPTTSREKPTTKPVAKQLFKSVLVPEGLFSAFVSYVESPDSFYCQVVAEDFVEMHNSMSELNEYFSMKKVNYNPAVGDVCAALFDEDQQWYRAKVVKVLNPKFFKIFFVDFGNVTDVIKENIQPLPEKYQVLPFQAFKARLADCYPVHNSWSREAISLFQKCQNSNANAKKHFERGDEQQTVLTLYMSENKTFNDHLVSLGVASKTPQTRPSLPPLARKREEAAVDTNIKLYSLDEFFPPVKTKLKVVISSLSKPGYFYCYVDNQFAEQVKNGSTQLAAYCKNSKPPPRSLIKEGLHCIAYFEKRHLWCRAVVSNVKESLIQVRSLDFGQAVWVLSKELRLLSEDFTHPPALALHCKLGDIIPKSGDWNEEYTATLVNFVNAKPMDALFAVHRHNTYVVKIPDVTNTLIQQHLGLYYI